MAYQNFYATKLQNSIGASDTTIEVQTPPTVTNGRLVLEPRNAQLREIIEFTGVSGTELTGVTRGLYGTSAQPHNSGVLLEMNLTAQDLTDLYDAFNSFTAAQNGGWLPLIPTPSVTATNGNYLYDISFPGDLSSILDKGMRLRIPRTGTVPTQVAELNGTTQYAVKTAPTGISFTDDFTIEAWVNLNSYPAAGFGTVLARRSSTANGWMILLTPEGRIRIQGSGATADYAISAVGVPLGRAVHIAATMDMSGNAATFYIDGALVPALTTSFTAATTLTQAGDMAIGRDPSAAQYYFPGKISEVRLWNAVRTQTQIQNNMNQQLVGTETNLVGYWKLNGNFQDSTANANHLTAQSGAVANVAGHPFKSTEYARIMTKPVFSAGNTTMKVWSGTDSRLPNQTLGSTDYSLSLSAFGLPDDLRKDAIYVRNDAAMYEESGASSLSIQYIMRVGDTLYVSFNNITTAVALADSQVNLARVNIASFGITTDPLNTALARLPNSSYVVGYSDGGQNVVELAITDTGLLYSVDIQPGTSMAAGNAVSGTLAIPLVTQ